MRTKTGEVVGEKQMWAEAGEREILDNTKEVYSGLIVAGKRAAEIILDML